MTTGPSHSPRPQDEHPLIGGDLDGGSPADVALRLIHRRAYVDAVSRAAGRSVLDIGCNDGYGTTLLAGAARTTVGIDVSQAAIAAARARPEAAAIEFRLTDGGALPFPDDSFEMVTAFQVIEHVAEVGPFLDEILRVTVAGGSVIFTTPNASIRLDPGMAPWNPFHVREYTADELRRELEPVFPEVRVRGLFAPAPVAALEIARATAARDRVRHPRPRLVQLAIDMLPDGARARLRRMKGTAGVADLEELRAVQVDDLWYSDDDLDTALDLQAICRTREHPGSMSPPLAP